MLRKTIALAPFLLAALWLAGAGSPGTGQPEIIMPQGDTAVPVIKPHGIAAWLDGNIKSVSVAGDGKTVAVSFNSSNPLGLYDLTNGKELFRFQKPNERIACVAFSPDGTSLATSGLKSTNTPVRIWDLLTRQIIHELPYCDKGCHRLGYSPNGKNLATMDASNKLCLWNVATGLFIVAVKAQEGNYLQCFAFSPDGTTLATGTNLGSIELRDLGGPRPLPELAEQKPRVTIELGDPSMGIFPKLVHVGFTPDGQDLVTACHDNLVQFWDPNTGKLKKKLAVPVVWEKERVDKLKSVSKNKYHTSWFINFAGIESLAFSPDGKTLALGCGNVFFIDMESNTLYAKSAPCGHVDNISFSTDGSYLVTASSPGAYVFKTPKR